MHVLPGWLVDVLPGEAGWAHFVTHLFESSLISCLVYLLTLFMYNPIDC